MTIHFSKNLKSLKSLKSLKTLTTSRLGLITLALLSVIPLLAFVQWHWVDALVRNEEERLTNGLELASVQLLFSFTQRLVQVQQAFLKPPAVTTNAKASVKVNAEALYEPATFQRIANDQWQAWRENENAHFVEALYYALPPRHIGDEWTLVRYDTTAQRLVSVEKISRSSVPSRQHSAEHIINKLTNKLTNNLTNNLTNQITGQIADELFFFPPISRTTAGLRAIFIPLALASRRDVPLTDLPFGDPSGFPSMPPVMPPTMPRAGGATVVSNPAQVVRQLAAIAKSPTLKRMMTMAALRASPYAYAVVVLNRDYIRRTLLPNLVQSHFRSIRTGRSDSIECECIVASEGTEERPRELVFTSATSDVNNEQSSTDISESTSANTSASASAKTSANASANALANILAKNDKRGTITLPIGFVPPHPSNEMAKFISTQIEMTPPPSLIMAEKDFLTKIFRRLGADSLTAQKLLSGTNLTVRFKANALETELSRLRWRNLAVSFGALLVLSAGLVVVVVGVSHSERLARQQMQFVAGVSHEFRTPLAVLSSASENLADGIVRTPEQAQRYGQVMKREIARLGGMVEQTLSFAGIQAGRHLVELAPVPLAALVAAAVQRNGQLLRDEGFVLENLIASAIEAETVLADASVVARVFDNLLANAVKYSTERRHVSIEAALSKENGGEMIAITIRDKGRGIAPSELRQVFEPFFRAQNVVDAQIHGNGLGLSIVHHIVQQHGGTITATSEEGQGSAFTFTLKKA